LRALQRELAGEISGPSAVYRVLDTTLVPAIVRVRASEASKGLFCGQATFGRSASKTEWIYGFKVALVSSDRHEAYLADKGFTGVHWERRWLQEYGSLVAATPKNDSRRAWPNTDRRWASFARQAPDHRGGLFGLDPLHITRAQVPYILLTLSKVAKTLMGLLIESARASMLPCDTEKMNSSRKGDAWTKK
jgi:hypothetical protein